MHESGFMKAFSFRNNIFHWGTYGGSTQDVTSYFGE